MAKVIKRKRKLSAERMLTCVFTISLFSYLGSTTVLHSYNINKNRHLQVLINENKAKEKEVEDLRLSVLRLTERDYLMSMCTDELTYENKRVFYVEVNPK